MSYEISLRPNDITTNDIPAQDEWVEIIEPNSKAKIYANLRSGICSKNPPDGVIVLTTDDFDDHWWELHDKKTGKYYYYNPERQVTVWTKPVATSDASSRVLIIPVSKLRTTKRISPYGNTSEKSDASTQTIASSLISTGTQTLSETTLDETFNDKLNLSDDSNKNSQKSNSCTHSRSIQSEHYIKSHSGQRQHSDLTGRFKNPYLKNYQRQATIGSEYTRIKSQDFTDHHTASQNNSSDLKDSTDPTNTVLIQDKSYFAPTSTYHKNRRSMQVQPSSGNYAINNRRDDQASSTSTFKSVSSSTDTSSDNRNGISIISKHRSEPQKMVTNNLSHYLVREARAMGIALISDDEVEEDEHDSEDECNLDDDEDTDLRDDLSSQQDHINNLNASQDLGEDSSEGWKSLSDQGSPNNARAKIGDLANSRMMPRSPILCETGQNSFGFDELVDDKGNPSAKMSQQLDNRKLVQNFKKSRQTSALGFGDSLSRSYKLDANQAVQKIKTVADTYFKHIEKEKLSEKHLRQISALSTLPRSSNNHNNNNNYNINRDNRRVIDGEVIDADYDVVEENCDYQSDSDHPKSMTVTISNGHSSKSTNSNETKNAKDPVSPVNYFERNKSTRGSTFSVESFARENLTRHPRGGLLFNRKVKWSRMISWTKNSIRQPMITSLGSDLNSEAIASFKLIQQFMGDRKINIGKKYRQILIQAGLKDEFSSQRKTLGRSSTLNVSNNSNSSTSLGNSTTIPQIPDRLRDELGYELAVKGCVKSSLRDEIFVQLARQLTDNPCQESVTWGLTLMSILLGYFSPSNKFAPFLQAFLETHSHPMARDVCLHRLEKRLRQNSLTYCRKPADGQEVAIVRLSITKWPQYCGIFGESLDRIMKLQTCSSFLKTLRLPWILTTLGEKLVETGGFETEGIFRCAADHDLLAQLRLEIDCVDFRKITDARQVKSLLSNVQDPHVIAGLLKLFFRQLYEPIFPSKIYDTCLESCHDNQMACRVFSERLPNLNMDVVAYLIRLLQMLSQSEKVLHTKMDTSNLSMVWAPNLLRAPELEQGFSTSTDSRNGSKWSIANGDEQTSMNLSSITTTTPSQSMIFEHARQEMQFIKALISDLDTSFIEGVL